MTEFWYKNAIFYAVDVDRFQDSNGDGIGDFQGLISRLDYLVDLGVTCLWLLPFYPAPNRDNGYDVKDYYGVDPRLGTLDDFIDLVHKAGERGIRVIIDLVMNHTSDQHPWFQASRRDRKSRYYDYYIWTDSPTMADKETVFPGEEKGVWTYDEVAGAYYHHLFYHFQPDLNSACDLVQDEMCKVLDFWMSFGISGVRVDAAPFMTMQKGLPSTAPRDPHGVLRKLSKLANDRRPDSVLLGESNVLPEELVEYFGDVHTSEFQLLFNFMLNNYLFLALARKKAEPLKRVIRLLPSVHEVGQWANFLRTLDEADLGRLDEAERQEVFAAFAPKETMQLYGRGIRRRIAPMLGGDRRFLEMAFSLEFSLPGTPLIIYGDEIGIGDDLKRDARYAVRPPMQWTAGRNAGFSTARVDKLVQPVISTGKFGSKKVNVEEQLANEKSFLKWVQKLSRTRRDCPEFGWGTWHIVDAPCDSAFVHLCEWKGKSVLAIHNMSDKPCRFDLDLTHSNARSLKPLLGNIAPEDKGDCNYGFQLEKYGYGWFRIEKT